MSKYLDRQVRLFWCLFFLTVLLLLPGCQSSGPGDKNTSTTTPLQNINNSTVAVTFGANGRLWRLIPTTDFVYIDYSVDTGATFSQPVKVNVQEQKINVWPENPPAIAVSKSGRIHVLYYADEDQKATSFYSYSDDKGLTFSEPALISDHARTAMHYMDKMLVDDNDKVYFFWHDVRHQNHNKQLGPGVLSLYFTTTDKSGSETFVNRKVSDGICSCCRTAVDFSPQKLPVILARVVIAKGIRDHALIRMRKNGDGPDAQRVTYDDWLIDACPEHGPALSIDDRGRSHMVWFTLGDNRQGIFYAHTDDYGDSISTPLQLGHVKHLPGHPDVVTTGEQVVLAWNEFDGEKNSVWIQISNDRGQTWHQPKAILSSTSQSNYPELITHGKKVFLSWTSLDKGHQIIKVN